MLLNFGHKVIINVSVLSLAALLIIFGVIAPTTKKINAVTSDTFKLRALMEQKYQQSLYSRLTKKQVETIREETASFPASLFTDKDMLKLIQGLEDIAKANSTTQKVGSFNTGGTNLSDQIDLNLDITGKYLDVLNHWRDLEAANYFFNINEARLTSLEAKNDANKQDYVNLTMALTIYAGR